MSDFLSPPSSCDWSRARHEGINGFLRERRLHMSFSSAPAVPTTMGLQLSAFIKHSSASTLWVSLVWIGWLRGCAPQFSREPHRPLQSNEFRFASFPRAWGMSYTARCNAPDFSLSSFCAFEELLIPILATSRLLISYSGVSVVENVVARLLPSYVLHFLVLHFASKILSSALAWQQRSGSAFAGRSCQQTLFFKSNETLERAMFAIARTFCLEELFFKPSDASEGGAKVRYCRSSLLAMTILKVGQHTRKGVAFASCQSLLSAKLVHQSERCAREGDACLG